MVYKRNLLKEPEIIVRNGKPFAIILDIHRYEELLERLEDAEDLAELKRIRKGVTRFRRIEDFRIDKRSHSY